MKFIYSPFSYIDKINGCPVFKKMKKGIGLKDILGICLSEKVPEKLICHEVPSAVTESAVFVVNLEKIKIEDLTTDDCGVYGTHSSPSEIVSVRLNDLGQIEDYLSSRDKDAENVLPVDKFVIKRQYSWHSKSKDFRRTIVQVEHQGQCLRYAIVQYLINCSPEVVHQLFQKPYGNSGKTTSGHFRTKPSVLANIKKLGTTNRPKQVISKLRDAVGGVTSVSSPSDIARDRQQVYNQLKKVPGRVKFRSTGPSKNVDIARLMSIQQEGNFLKDVNFFKGVRKQKDHNTGTTHPNTFAAH